MSVPVLSAEQVLGAITPLEAVEAILAALRSGLLPADDPPRQAVPTRTGQLLLMPAEAGAVAGVKVVSVAPRNGEHGRPRIQGSYLLLDSETLSPQAILDGAALTLVRTPAVALAAARDAVLARDGDLHVVIFGGGPQAESHVRTVRSVFAERGVASLEILDSRAGYDPEVLRRARLVMCATSSSTPLFPADALAPDAVVTAIGSHTPEARELDGGLFLGATVIIEEHETALREAGDIVQAVAEGTLSPSDLIGIEEIATGRRVAGPGRVIVKTTGMAWEDLVIAEAIARRHGMIER
jgi:ornithine cyclodeaminase